MSKTITPNFWGFPLLFLLVFSAAVAQVGINTTDPNGILDITSTNQGVVMPKVSLTSTLVQAPVLNPKSGVTVIPEGTTVYNDNTTTNAANNVYPGLYVWDGTKWLAYETEKQNEIFFQSNVGSLRSVNGVNAIAGLTGETFTARYTGTYRVEVHVNLGGGGARVPNEGSTSDGWLNIAKASGLFTLNFDGVNYNIPAHAYSTSYDSSEGATNYFAIWQQYSIVFTRPFTAGDVVPLTMTFTQDVATTYVSDGNSGSGRGYVGYDIPCSVEVNYIGE